jgi:predicted RNase H-like nuclease (RuvC/YqgF family)
MAILVLELLLGGALSFINGKVNYIENQNKAIENLIDEGKIEAQIEISEKKLNNITDVNNNLTTEINNLKSEINLLKSEIEQLKRKLDKLTEQLDSSKQEPQKTQEK